MVAYLQVSREQCKDPSVLRNVPRNEGEGKFVYLLRSSWTRGGGEDGWVPGPGEWTED